jgi:membrane protease YdiL (CAAX protease family)
MSVIKQWFNSKAEIQLAITIGFICLMLTMREYWGSGEQLSKMFFNTFFPTEEPEHFHRMLAWSSGCVFFFLIIPALFSTFVNKQSLIKTGFSITFPAEHVKIYLLMLMVVLPMVVIASFNAHFQETYPFYYFPKDEFPIQRFITWEVFYLLQFVAIEYFFRGFILFNCKPIFQEFSVYISVIPYCMIHFGKPMPETIGAILAGIFLGKMALRSGSILPGIALHYTVAISMDLLSLWQQDYF